MPSALLDYFPHIRKIIKKSKCKQAQRRASKVENNRESVQKFAESVVPLEVEERTVNVG